MIVLWPDDKLSKSTEKVQVFDDFLLKEINLMFSEMEKEKGVGLAANQIGISRSIFVMNYDSEKRIFINPSLELSGKLISIEEGCLSFPTIKVKVWRKETALVSYQDENGKEHKEEFRGIKSIIIQHEFDHLNGKVFVDYLSDFSKHTIKQRMKKIKDDRL